MPASSTPFLRTTHIGLLWGERDDYAVLEEAAHLGSN